MISFRTAGSPEPARDNNKVIGEEGLFSKAGPLPVCYHLPSSKPGDAGRHAGGGHVETDRWKLLQQLFEQALAAPAAERQRWIAEACGHDEALRQQVESLVLAERATGLVGEIVGAAAAKLEPAGVPGAGDRIGPYRIERELGRGGMGVVYLARRDDEAFEKHVAIKLVRSGCDTAEALARFRAERRMLASLDHPNIARVLDGGEIAPGLPFVVMEYVDGLPLPDYCAAHSLTIHGRLRLFRKVCAAVEYAHQHLIVHRDLKPGNILVTAAGEPKLLDFGIAKLLEPEFAAADDAAPTRLRAMTPEYASPEQVRGTPAGTTSDIYSLGVLLYELLTGERPYAIRSTDATAIEKAVCESDPPPPGAVRAELKGDVENIVLMAMRKEPARRYPSAGRFSEDIGRYLDGYPVTARRDTWKYRATKFVGRNRWPVAAGAVLGLVLAASILQIAQARSLADAEAARARREAATAREVTDFLVRSFAAADPWRSAGEKVTAAQILQSSQKRIATELAAQPAVRANLLESIGLAYRGLGLFQRSREVLEESLAVRRRLFGDRHPDVAKSLTELAQTVDELGEPAQVRELTEQALRAAGDAWTPGDLRRLDTEERRGLVILALGDHPAAEKALLEMLEKRRRYHGVDHQDYPAALLSTGLVYDRKGEYARAEPYYREAYEIRRRQVGEEHPDVARAINNLAMTRFNLGQPAEGEKLWRRALEIQKKTLGENHPEVAISLNNLGYALSNRGKLVEALDLYRQVIAIHRRIGREEHPWVAMTYNNIGIAHRDRGDWKAAAEAYRQSLALNYRLYGQEHPEIANVTSNLAIALTEGGRWREAEELQRKALAMKRKVVPGSVQLALSMDSLSVILLRLGRPGDLAEAAGLAAEALESGRKTLPPGHWRLADFQVTLGTALGRQGQRDEARGLLREAAAMLEKARGAQAEVSRRARRELELLDAPGRR